MSRRFEGSVTRSQPAALSGLLMQALRELAEEHVTPARRELVKDIRIAPAWMHPIFRELAENKA
jgi:hypothetical protein